MTIIDAVAMLGAIAVLLFGMSTMTDGLEKFSSGRLEKLLERLTSNVFKGVLLGAVVTGLMQSSTAPTVMFVGFVNAAIIKLERGHHHGRQHRHHNHRPASEPGRHFLG